MEPISISYNLSRSEFLAAMAAMWKYRNQSTRTLLVWGGAGLGAGAVLWILVAPWAGTIAGVIGGLLLLMAALRPKLFGLAYDKTPEYAQGLTLTLDDQAVFIESGGKKSRLPWDKVDRLTPMDGYVVLYLKSRNFIVAPASAFAESSDLHRAKRLVHQKAAERH